MDLGRIDSIIRSRMSGMNVPDILLYKELDSTNDYLKKMALQDTTVPEGTTVVSLCQTNGRGRSGRSFFSPQDSSLYFSILLKPTVSFEQALIITPMAAVAVYECMKELFGTELSIKWVNDLYLNNRKVCGILAEGEAVARNGISYPKYIVLGIGINLFSPNEEIPADISDKYGAVFSAEGVELPKNYADKSREEILADLIMALSAKIMSLYTASDKKGFMKTYRNASMLIGREVSYETGQGAIRTEVMDIDDDGALVCRDRFGNINHYRDGEISLIL